MVDNTRLDGHDGTVWEELAVGERGTRSILGTARLGADSVHAVGLGEGRVGRRRQMVEVVFGQVAGKVPDNRVVGAGAEELQGVLPLLGADQLRVGDDLDGERLQRLVELTEALLPAGRQEPVKLLSSVGIVRDLEDVVVKGFGVLNSGGKGVIAVVECRIEVVLLHAELPEGPRPVNVVHVARVEGGVKPQFEGTRPSILRFNAWCRLHTRAYLLLDTGEERHLDGCWRSGQRD